MKIIRLDVKETESGWHLKDARFDDINLLVGVSGVGKTKIVEVIRTLAAIATTSSVGTFPMSWRLDFGHQGQSYRWEGEIARTNLDEQELGVEKLYFAREILSVDDNVIIDRDPTRIRFKDTTIPPLKASESALSLLAEEHFVLSARTGLMLVAFASGNKIPFDGFQFATKRQKNAVLKKLEMVADNLPDSMASSVGLTPLSIFGNFFHRWVASFASEKNAEILFAYLTKRTFPGKFDNIITQFGEIFPSVTEVTVDFEDQLRDGGDALLLQFAIKEQNCNQWILQPQISSGMLRTLIHLFAVDAALPGSVLVIDEFENSLGKNCLPHITDSVQEHLGEVQFILTSHHPYVISQLPIEYWKLVRRHGSTVTLTSARDIPALMDESHHDAFDRLLNIDEFIDGIEPFNELKK